MDGTVARSASSNWLLGLGRGLFFLLLLSGSYLAQAANPVLVIQGLNLSGGDNTAFVDVVEIVNASTGLVVINSAANPSFETTGPLSNGAYGYNPSGATWQFNSQSGIAQNGSNFGAPTTLDGTNVAFIQSSGAIQQLLTLGAGRYYVRFQVAQRGCCSGTNDQRLNVLVDGVSVGTVQPTYTLSNNQYITFVSTTFAVDAPTITGFTPGNGFRSTTVTLSGTNFTNATAVSFNGVAAASFVVVSATTITAVVSVGGFFRPHFGYYCCGNGIFAQQLHCANGARQLAGLRWRERPGDSTEGGPGQLHNRVLATHHNDRNCRRRAMV